MKTSELTGAALDWAVAKCEYDNRRYNYGSPCFSPTTKRVYETKGLQEIGVNFAPSEEWKQGGPIIEREEISILYRVGVNMSANINGQYEQSVPYNQRGNAQLTVAMRCYVASKLGDNIDIPKELTA